MKRKLFTLSMVLILILVVSSCGNKNDNKTSESDGDKAMQTQEQTEDNNSSDTQQSDAEANQTKVEESTSSEADAAKKNDTNKEASVDNDSKNESTDTKLTGKITVEKMWNVLKGYWRSKSGSEFVCFIYDKGNPKFNAGTINSGWARSHASIDRIKKVSDNIYEITTHYPAQNDENGDKLQEYVGKILIDTSGLKNKKVKINPSNTEYSTYTYSGSNLDSLQK